MGVSDRATLRAIAAAREAAKTVERLIEEASPGPSQNQTTEEEAASK